MSRTEEVVGASHETLFLRIVALQVAATRPGCIGHIEHKRTQPFQLQLASNVDAVTIHHLNFLGDRNVSFVLEDYRMLDLSNLTIGRDDAGSGWDTSTGPS